MKIAIGSDHAGYKYKEKIKQLLSDWDMWSLILAPVRKSLSTTLSSSVQWLSRSLVARPTAGSCSRFGQW